MEFIKGTLHAAFRRNVDVKKILTTLKAVLREGEVSRKDGA
jgi:hypothetical protein